MITAAAIAPASAPARRPMTDAEKSSWLLNEVASMQGSHIVRIRGHLDEQLLRRALRKLQQRHFLLRCRVIPGPPLQFEEVAAEIPLTVEPWREDLWIAEAEREVDDAIPWADGPMARALLLQGPECCDLILSMHKAMHDGRSGAHALRDILEFAAAELENREPQLPALTGTYDITEQVRRKSKLLRLIPFFARYLTTIVVMRPQSLPAEGSAPMEKLETGLYPCLLSEEETAALRRHCREQKTTVQGALSAALMQAVAKELCETKKLRRVAVDNTATYDVRALLDTGVDDSMGTFVSATISFHYAGPSVGFWDLAREVRREIAHNVNSGLVFTMIRIQTMMSSKAKSPEQLRGQVDKFRKPATFVTNMGLLDYPRKVGPWIRESQTCVLSAKHFGGGCLCATAMTVSGRLGINFFFAKQCISREHVAKLAADVLSYLRF
jgi:hypothetical protein